jgi:hypothetical protein
VFSGELIRGAVYIARTTGAPFVKIGLTVCIAEEAARAVQTRLRKLQKGCPLPLKLVTFAHVKDCPGIERELLERFTRQRVFGEWLKVRSPRLVARELERLAGLAP